MMSIGWIRIDPELGTYVLEIKRSEKEVSIGTNLSLQYLLPAHFEVQ